MNNMASFEVGTKIETCVQVSGLVNLSFLSFLEQSIIFKFTRAFTSKLAEVKVTWKSSNVCLMSVKVLDQGIHFLVHFIETVELERLPKRNKRGTRIVKCI